MRRHALHIFVALLAFTFGFLTVGKVSNLTVALPLALLVFASISLAGNFRPPNFNAHKFKVAALTFLLCIPLLAFFLTLLPRSGFSDCVLTFPEEEAGAIAAAGEEARADLDEAADDFGSTGLTVYWCGGKDAHGTATHAIWAGVLDKKAVRKLGPFYTPRARAEGVTGVVAVSVLVDESGEVLWAQALSGHPLLRQPAMDAACDARFAPALVNGPPIRVSGILTYAFAIK